MEINMFKQVKVNAKTIKVHCKVSDSFSGGIYDQDGQELLDIDHDYVPPFFPEGGGDYLILDIDLDTGFIKNWEAPAAEEIQDYIKAMQEDA